MTSIGTVASLADSTSGRPLLFISHRHADRPIADILRRFAVERSGGRIAVYQSSAAESENPRVGRELQRELKEALWAAGIVILVFTSPDEDWSYCMWECGVATHPTSPETKVIVLQCTPHPPSVYSDAVRINAQDPVSVLKFVNEFLTSRDFFPDYPEAVAPGFHANGEEVQQAASELYEALKDVIPSDSDEGEDWATVPFVRLQLTYSEVDRIRELDAAEGIRAVIDASRVNEIDGAAMRLFGVGRVTPFAPFSGLVDAWRERWPKASTRWVDELSEQVRVGSHWQLPRFRWQLMRSSDSSDHAKYAPILSRVSSIPRERCHHFDVYFNKFDTTEKGAISIGFAEEPQATPKPLPRVMPTPPEE